MGLDLAYLKDLVSADKKSFGDFGYTVVQSPGTISGSIYSAILIVNTCLFTSVNLDGQVINNLTLSQGNMLYLGSRPCSFTLDNGICILYKSS